MSFQLKTQVEASNDINEIAIWYDEKLDGLGDRFELDLKSALGLLKKIPKSFQVRHAPYRQIHLESFPCSVVYEIEDNLVIVVAVVAQKDDPKKLRERLF